MKNINIAFSPFIISYNSSRFCIIFISVMIKQDFRSLFEFSFKPKDHIHIHLMFNINLKWVYDKKTKKYKF